MTNTELWAIEFRKGILAMTSYMHGMGNTPEEISLATESHRLILERLDAEIVDEQRANKLAIAELSPETRRHMGYDD